MAKRGGMACPRERAAYIFVEAPGGPDVPDVCACAHRARQSVAAGASLCPVRPIGRIGRGRPFGHQRRAVWSRQSEERFGPQRHRQCLEPAAPPQQHPGPRGRLDTYGTDTICHPAVLFGRITAQRRRLCCRARKQGAVPPARPAAGQLLHRHLPGLLGPWIDLDSPMAALREFDRDERGNQVFTATSLNVTFRFRG